MARVASSSTRQSAASGFSAVCWCPKNITNHGHTPNPTGTFALEAPHQLPSPATQRFYGKICHLWPLHQSQPLHTQKGKPNAHQPLYNRTSRSSPRDREKVFLLLKGKRSWKFRNKIAKRRNRLFLKGKSKVPVGRAIGVTAENRDEKQAKKAVSHGKYRFGAVRALFLTL